MFLVTPVLSQEKSEVAPSDSLEVDNIDSEENNDIDEQYFIDKDGDGINDRIQQDRSTGRDEGQQTRNRQSDVFIDKDGDGINDQRCSGMGINDEGRGRRGGRK